MKKVKYIALALVLCLGLIGGAYALWEQELTVDGYVETGTFNVEFSQCFGQLTSGSPEHALDNYVMDMEGGVTDPHNAWFDFKYLYPVETYGHGPLLRLRGENKGTTPAYLESVDVDLDWSDEALKDYMMVNVQVAMYNGTSWSIVGGSGNRPLTELAQAIEDAAAGMVLEEGYRFTFGSDDPDSVNSIRFFLHESAPMEMQNQWVDMDIKLNFRQWNL